MDISELALRAQVAWFRGLAASGFPQLSAGVAGRVPGWPTSEVTDARALRENHRVYADDGWWDEPGELDHHVEVAARLGFGPGRPVRHWTARHQGVPVGAATSFQFGDAVLLAHACVAAPWRRQGIGTALTRVRAVLFPSPDGYHLHHSLGFGLAPAHPNRWFYLGARGTTGGPPHRRRRGCGGAA